MSGAALAGEEGELEEQGSGSGAALDWIEYGAGVFLCCRFGRRKRKDPRLLGTHQQRSGGFVFLFYSRRPNLETPISLDHGLFAGWQSMEILF